MVIFQIDPKMHSALYLFPIAPDYYLRLIIHTYRQSYETFCQILRKTDDENNMPKSIA